MENKEKEEKKEKLAKDLFALNKAAKILEIRKGESFNLRRDCPTLYNEISKILQELADSLEEQPKKGDENE